jgi:hypothetical protein
LPPPGAARGLFGIAGIVALLMLLASSAPAAAQFVCTTTPSDITCTNSGTAAGIDNTANGAGQNATTTNAGTNSGVTFSVTTGGGNATATNSGSSAGLAAQTINGGNAIATNSGSNTGGIGVATNNGGDAVLTNSGTNTGGIAATTVNGGNAVATNSGSNTGGITVETFAGGNATATNSGSNTGGVTVETFAGGNVSATNSGSNAGGFFVQANAGGNATGINTGNNTGGFNISIAGAPGNAVGINSGSNSGTFIVDTISGNALGINTGINTGAFTVFTNANGNAVAVNSGTITAGTLTLAAAGVGNTETLTNSGTVSNFGGTAIAFFGGPDTLNLLAGSNITGAINLIGANDTVNFLSGNHNLTFNTLAGATVNGPDPFVVSGNRAAAIDPTPFGLADKNLMDFTRGVSGMLDSIGGGAAPSGPISSAFAPSERGTFAARVEDTFASIPALAYANDNAMVFKAPSIVASDGRAVWARGFGGERTQDGDGGALVGARTTFLGGAVGFDLLARPDLRLGLFAGGGESRMSLDTNLGFTHTDTAFGGLYGRWGFASFGRASFLDFALHGGGSGNSMSRTVNNNLIAGGIEIATASYNSSYISPELKYGIDVPLWAQYTLTPSVRVRYVAGFFGGYTEAGTTAPLTVNSRTIQDLEERGELKLTRAMPVGPDLLLTSIHVGAIGLERVGDTTVSTVLLGINLPFVTPGRSDVAGVVGGGGFEWRTREGVSVFGAAEAIGFSDQSTVWSARGGLRVAF